MGTDIAKAFESQNGFLIEDGPFITGGTASPSGLDLPVATLYIQNGTTGTIFWRKYSTGVNDWTQVSLNDFRQKTNVGAETSTTSTVTFLNKLTITTPTLPSGDYRLDYRFTWRAANANRSIDLRVQRNAANVVTWNEFTASVAANPSVAGFVNFTAISGVQTLTLDFKVNGSGTTVFMKDAYLDFRRTA